MIDRQTAEKIDAELGEGTTEEVQFRADHCESAMLGALGNLNLTDWVKWMYKDEGEVVVTQLSLPKGLVNQLEKMGETERELCDACPNREICERVGIRDNQVRAVLTEVLRLGISSLGCLGKLAAMLSEGKTDEED